MISKLADSAREFGDRVLAIVALLLLLRLLGPKLSWKERQVYFVAWLYGLESEEIPRRW